MINLLRKIKRKVFPKKEYSKEFFIEGYKKNGQIPWSNGYTQHKEQSIKNVLNNLSIFDTKKLPENYGYRLDERIIEYPWALNKISVNKTKILDAGSVLNYDFIVNHQKLKEKELYIQTFYPENNCFFNKRISYVYEDLRNIPFKDNFFDEIVCISTLEHIDMDNSMYGYDLKKNEEETRKSYEYINVINELVRVLDKKGKLLLTFPFGKFENHGFFQQFDDEMVNRMLSIFETTGLFETYYYRYKKNGWIYSNLNECKNSISYNPHTGIGKGTDNAAHSRAICCIEFIKN